MTTPDLSLPSPLTTPEVYAVRLCCQVELTPAICQILEKQLTQVTDWEVLIEYATENFVLPLVSHHLAHIECVPQLIRQQFKQHIVEATRRSLLHLAELTAIRRQLPDNTPCLIVKGLAISSVYYKNIALRFQRDIDLLLPVEHIQQLVPQLLNEGHTLITMRDHIKNNPEDLSTLIDYFVEIGINTPRGVLVEYHQKLSLIAGNFPLSVKQLFAEKAEIKIGSETFYTLKPEINFAYLCYHHARHHWSRLHWLADINIIINSNTLDWNLLNSQIKKLGQQHAVASALRLCAAVLNNSTAQEQLSALQLNQYGMHATREGLKFLQPGVIPPEKTQIKTTIRYRAQVYFSAIRSQTNLKDKLGIMCALYHPTFLDYVAAKRSTLPRGLLPVIRFFRILFSREKTTAE